MRGFSDAYGSWKMICMSRRSFCISPPPAFITSMPSKVTEPDVASMRRSTARPVVDLPQPLSPTRPRVSPFSTAKLTPSTAYTVPVWRLRTPDLIGKCFLRSRTSRRLTTPPP